MKHWHGVYRRLYNILVQYICTLLIYILHIYRCEDALLSHAQSPAFQQTPRPTYTFSRDYSFNTTGSDISGTAAVAIGTGVTGISGSVGVGGGSSSRAGEGEGKEELSSVYLQHIYDLIPPDVNIAAVDKLFSYFHRREIG